jgi:hypothetical protein
MAVVERIHPLVVTVSAMMPREAAALASLSALLPPMKTAERSGLVEGIPVEQDRSLEMSGQVSRANKKCVLSPSKRRLRSEASFSGRCLVCFFSSRRNWDSDNPSPVTECATPPPHPVLGGGAHSLAREGLGESQFRRGDIHCGTLYIYALCVLNTLTYVSAVGSKIIRRLGKDLLHVLQSQGRPLTLQKYLRPVQLWRMY